MNNKEKRQVVKNCLYCKKDLTKIQISKKRKFCCKEHFYKFQYERKIKLWKEEGRAFNCVICGKQLSWYKVSNNRPYCSEKCQFQLNHKDDVKFCLNCGKPLSHVNILRHNKFCSVKCATHNIQTKQKIKNTLYKHYGVDVTFKSKQIVEKSRNTLLKKTGYDNSLKDPKVREKIKNTNIERYGCQSSLGNLQVRQKVKNTNLQKYGYQNPFFDKKVQERIIQSNIEKYGVKSTFQLQWVKEKSKQTCLEKYGVKNVIQNKCISQKAINSKYVSMYFKLKTKLSKYVIPLFTQEEYNGWKKGQVYKWKCVKCGNEFESKIQTNRLPGIDCLIPRCLKCYPKVNFKYSLEEKQVLDYVKHIYFGQVLCNVKNIITPYQIDIYLPELKCGIQFDGCMWHSIEFHDYEYNLLRKTEMCQDKGIKLIHILQNRWLENQQLQKKILKQRLFNKQIDFSQRIFDRCYYSKLDFLNKNIEIIQPKCIKVRQFHLYDVGEIKLCE